MAAEAAALPVVDAGLSSSAAPAINTYYDAGAQVRLDAVAPGLGNQLGGNEGLVAARLESFLGGRRILLPELPTYLVIGRADGLGQVAVLEVGPIKLLGIETMERGIVLEIRWRLPVLGRGLAIFAVPKPGQENQNVIAVAPLGGSLALLLPVCGRTGAGQLRWNRSTMPNRLSVASCLWVRIKARTPRRCVTFQ